MEFLEERAVPATFAVGSLADAGSGPLREAIALAAANQEADTTVFAPELAGQKIALTSNSENRAFGPTALMIVNDDVTIDGAAARLLEIGGNDERRIFAVGARAKLTLQNLTLTEGRAQGGHGGATFNRNGQFNIVNSTIRGDVGTQGRVVVNLGDGSGMIANAYITNTILGGASVAGVDFVGAFRDGGITASSGVGNLMRGHVRFSGQVGLLGDPALTPLAENGGPTMTMAPAADSPVVDAGNAAGNALPTDQRGQARVSGAGIDIGAFEIQQPAPPAIVDPGSLYFAAGSYRSYTITLTGSPTPVLDDYDAPPTA